MFTIILSLAIGLALLLVGAEWLVRGSSRLAIFLGISPLVIGLTVVAFGTSAPELATSLISAYHGRGDVALGNVIGSNIVNIGLVLGLAGLLMPIRVDDTLNTRMIPFLLVISVVLLLFGRSLEISRLEGLTFLGLFVLFIWYSLRSARLGIGLRATSGPQKDPGAVAARPDNTEIPAGKVPLLKAALLVVTGLILLGSGAQLFVRSAVEFAHRVGLSEAVVGVTIVALGTSLPELVASVVAAYRRLPSLAIGNIVGSNVFNILAIAGTTASVFPFAISPALVNFSLPVMLGFTGLLMLFCFSRGRVNRLEAGVLVLCTVLYAVALLRLS
jgi:cation:H+ antiporter